jgi:hypothetical protein
MVKQIPRVLLVLVVLVASVILTAAVALAFALGSARHVQHQAEACFADFLKLEVGRSTFADLTKLRQKYGGIVFTTQWKDCTPQHCAYQFNFHNIWLQRFHLAPRVVFGLALRVENNLVTSREMYYGEDPVDTPATDATHVTETYTVVEETIPEEMMRGLDPLPGTKDFKVSVQTDSRGQPFHYGIWMTTNSPHDDRMRAYSVDLQCLARIGECDRGRILAAIDVPHP